jgi:hypothetical protein
MYIQCTTGHKTHIHTYNISPVLTAHEVNLGYRILNDLLAIDTSHQYTLHTLHFIPDSIIKTFYMYLNICIVNRMISDILNL